MYLLVTADKVIAAQRERLATKRREKKMEAMEVEEN